MGDDDFGRASVSVTGPPHPLTPSRPFCAGFVCDARDKTAFEWRWSLSFVFDRRTSHCKHPHATVTLWPIADFPLLLKCGRMCRGKGPPKRYFLLDTAPRHQRLGAVFGKDYRCGGPFLGTDDRILKGGKERSTTRLHHNVPLCDGCSTPTRRDHRQSRAKAGVDGGAWRPIRGRWATGGGRPSGMTKGSTPRRAPWFHSRSAYPRSNWMENVRDRRPPAICVNRDDATPPPLWMTPQTAFLDGVGGRGRRGTPRERGFT